MRSTLHLTSSVRTELKRLALDTNTTEPEALASATLNSDFPPELHTLGIRLRCRGLRRG